MPRVPEVTVTRQLQPLQVAQQRETTAASFGGVEAAAIQQLGAQAFEFTAKLQDRQDLVAANNAYMSAQSDLRGFLYDPQKGLFAQKAGLAAQSADRTNQFLQSTQQKYIQGLSKRQSQMFQQNWDQTAQRTMQSASVHEMQELKAFEAATFSGLVTQHADGIVIERDNYGAVSQSVDAIRQNITALHPGAPVVTLQNLTREVTTAAHLKALDAHLGDKDENGRTNWKAAEDYFKNFQTQIDPGRWRTIRDTLEAARVEAVSDEAVDILTTVMPRASLSEVVEAASVIMTGTKQEADLIRKKAETFTNNRDKDAFEKLTNAINMPGGSPERDRNIALGAASAKVRQGLLEEVEKKYTMSASDRARMEVNAVENAVTNLLLKQMEENGIYGPKYSAYVEGRLDYWTAQRGLDLEDAIKKAVQEGDVFEKSLSLDDAIAEAQRMAVEPAFQQKMVASLQDRKNQQDKLIKERREVTFAEINTQMGTLHLPEARKLLNRYLSEGSDPFIRDHALNKFTQVHGSPIYEPAAVATAVNDMRAQTDNGAFLLPNGRVNMPALNDAVARLPEAARKEVLEYAMKAEEQVNVSFVASSIGISLGKDKKKDKMANDIYNRAMAALPAGLRGNQDAVKKVVNGLLMQQARGDASSGRSIFAALQEGEISDPRDPQQYLPYVETSGDERELYTQMLLNRGVALQNIVNNPNLLKLMELQDTGLVADMASFENSIENLRRQNERVTAAQAARREVDAGALPVQQESHAAKVQRITADFEDARRARAVREGVTVANEDLFPLDDDSLVLRIEQAARTAQEKARETGAAPDLLLRFEQEAQEAAEPQMFGTPDPAAEFWRAVHEKARAQQRQSGTQLLQGPSRFNRQGR